MSFAQFALSGANNNIEIDDLCDFRCLNIGYEKMMASKLKLCIFSDAENTIYIEVMASNQTFLPFSDAENVCYLGFLASKIEFYEKSDA